MMDMKDRPVVLSLATAQTLPSIQFDNLVAELLPFPLVARSHRESVGQSRVFLRRECNSCRQSTRSSAGRHFGYFLWFDFVHHHPVVRAVVHFVKNVFEDLEIDFDGGSICNEEVIVSKVGAVVDPGE